LRGEGGAMESRGVAKRPFAHKNDTSDVRDEMGTADPVTQNLACVLPDL
jgi:hypothetical protein